MQPWIKVLCCHFLFLEYDQVHFFTTDHTHLHNYMKQGFVEGTVSELIIYAQEILMLPCCEDSLGENAASEIEPRRLNHVR